jgi:hypothetical protein
MKNAVTMLFCALCCCLLTASCISFGGESSPEPIANASSLQDYAGIYADKSADSPPAHLSARFGMTYNYMLSDTNDDKPTRIEIKVGKRGLEATAFHGDTVGLTGEMRVKSLIQGRIDLGVRSEKSETKFFLTNYSEKTTCHETLGVTKSGGLVLVEDFSTTEWHSGLPSHKTYSRYYVFKRVE